MSDYRRYLVPGGTYFFTVVTYQRRPIFASDDARECLGRVMRACLARYPVEVIATVLLPDHLHTLWTLPPSDSDYSLRWRWIKREFTRAQMATDVREPVRATSRVRQRLRGVWQRRFHEHTIRDEDDLEAHLDYIHYNPVKHGLVKRPRDWPWSTFHRWVEAGHYDIDWGGSLQPIDLPGNAGE